MKKNYYYGCVFLTNILKILEEKKMTRSELSELSGVSPSFLSDLTKGKGNPSLNTMEDIAKALKVSLPILLESTDLDNESIKSLGLDFDIEKDSLGYQLITVVLDDYNAFRVKKLSEEINAKRIKKSIDDKKT